MHVLTNAYSINMFGVKQPSDEIEDHQLRFNTLYEDDVRGMMISGKLRSAIGHESTATILSERLGVPVEFNREDVIFPSADVESLVVAQITKRLPPGVELNAEEVRALPIVYWQVSVLPMTTMHLASKLRIARRYILDDIAAGKLKAMKIDDYFVAIEDAWTYLESFRYHPPQEG